MNAGLFLFQSRDQIRGNSANALEPLFLLAQLFLSDRPKGLPLQARNLLHHETAEFFAKLFDTIAHVRRVQMQQKDSATYGNARLRLIL